MLTACIDYSRSPPTYDTVTSLLVIKAEAIRLKQDSIRVVFLPGPRGGYRDDNLWPRSVETRETLFKSIALPMCGMLPGVVAMERPGPADMGALDGPVMGVGQALHAFPGFVRSLPVTGRCLRPRRDLRRNPRLVTITLREAEHWPTRNSKVDEWLTAAHQIADMGFEVVLVRDTACFNQALPGFRNSVDAASDLNARASLYRSAFCNLFVSNGPAWFAMALDAPLIMLKIADDTPGGCPASSANYLRQCGLRYGDQMPGAGDHQRLVWAEDRADTIVGAFEQYAALQCAAA